MVKTITPIAICLAVWTFEICAAQDPEPICISTGSNCINGTSDCPFINAAFQWCYGCGHYIVCNFGTGTWAQCDPPEYLFESNSGICAPASTTCRECMVEIPAVPPEDRCRSTGPRCLELTDCVGAEDALYQWCGDCNYYVRCLGRQGTLYSIRNQQQIWDDHVKAAMEISTTCTECYFPCPPLSEPPSTEPSVECNSTGPNCVHDVSICIPIPYGIRLQYCGNCRSYVNCPGALGIPSIYFCPDNTTWDDDLKDCSDVSTTCIECYTQCNDSVTLETTIVLEIEETTNNEASANELSTEKDSGVSNSLGSYDGTTETAFTTTTQSSTVNSVDGFILLLEFIVISLFSAVANIN